ncbi:hypothetical protein HOD20_05670, partial [archaeon]|nr:hypothetical protein [archaeon]
MKKVYSIILIIILLVSCNLSKQYTISDVKKITGHDVVNDGLESLIDGWYRIHGDLDSKSVWFNPNEDKFRRTEVIPYDEETANIFAELLESEMKILEIGDIDSIKVKYWEKVDRWVVETPNMGIKIEYAIENNLISDLGQLELKIMELNRKLYEGNIAIVVDNQLDQYSINLETGDVFLNDLETAFKLNEPLPQPQYERYLPTFVDEAGRSGKEFYLYRLNLQIKADLNGLNYIFDFTDDGWYLLHSSERFLERKTGWYSPEKNMWRRAETIYTDRTYLDDFAYALKREMEILGKTDSIIDKVKIVEWKIKTPLMPEAQTVWALENPYMGPNIVNAIDNNLLTPTTAKTLILDLNKKLHQNGLVISDVGLNQYSFDPITGKVFLNDVEQFYLKNLPDGIIIHKNTNIPVEFIDEDGFLIFVEDIIDDQLIRLGHLSVNSIPAAASTGKTTEVSVYSYADDTTKTFKLQLLDAELDLLKAGRGAEIFDLHGIPIPKPTILETRILKIGRGIGKTLVVAGIIATVYEVYGTIADRIEATNQIQIGAKYGDYITKVENIDENLFEDYYERKFDQSPLFYEYNRVFDTFTDPIGDECKIIRFDDNSRLLATIFLPDYDLITPIQICATQNTLTFKNTQTYESIIWEKINSNWEIQANNLNKECFTYYAKVSSSYEEIDAEFKMCFDAIKGLVNTP